MVRSFVVAWLVFVGSSAHAQTRAEVLTRMLEALAAERLDTLGAPHVAPDEDAPTADAPTRALIGATRGCKRPDDAQAARLQARVERWVAALHPRASWADDGVHLTFGCFERDGLVLDVHVDARLGDDARGYYWVVRLHDGALTVVAAQVGSACADYMEWAREDSVGTLALVDLDHDGDLDPLVVRQLREGGATAYESIFYGERAGRLVDLGRDRGAVELLATQPAAADGVLILRHTFMDYGDDAAAYYQLRCLGLDEPLTACATADALRRREDVIAQARAILADSDPLADDATALADTLTTLGVLPLVRMAWLALAPPATFEQRVAAFERHELQAGGRLTEVERQAAVTARAADLRARVSAALGDEACRAVRDELRLVSAWIRRHATRPRAIVPTGGCASAAAAYVTARWLERDEEGGTRTALGLFFVRAGLATPLFRTGLYRDGNGDVEPSLEVALSVHGGTLRALVADEGGLRAFVGGRETASVASMVIVHGLGELVGDDGASRTYWVAAADGLSQVAAVADPSPTNFATALPREPLAALLTIEARRGYARYHLEELGPRGLDYLLGSQ